MRVIKSTILTSFGKTHPDVEQQLKTFLAEAESANWKTPHDIKQRYHHADFLANNRVIINIKGNKYRLILLIHYNIGTIIIRFIGTHAQYDKIDAERI